MPDVVKLELLNPRGQIEPLPVFAPSPRLPDLAGKKIGLYSNTKPGMDNFYAVFEELLKQKYPSATTVFMRGAFEITDKDARALAQQVDTWINGVGD
jgi:hypothetical protein